MMWGRLDDHMSKNETRFLSYTIDKNPVKLFKYLNIKAENMKLLEENIGGKILDIGLSNNFLDSTP